MNSIFTYNMLEEALKEYDFRIHKSDLMLLIMDNVSDSVVASIHRNAPGVLSTEYLYSQDNDSTTRGYLPYLYQYAMTNIHQREE